MKGILLEDFAPVVSVKYDSYGKIVKGLIVGDILVQNQALILNLHPGELKDFPAVGCGISDMLLDMDPLFWRARIREQLEMDGQIVDSIKITTKEIQIKATYKND